MIASSTNHYYVAHVVEGDCDGFSNYYFRIEPEAGAQPTPEQATRQLRESDRLSYGEVAQVLSPFQFRSMIWPQLDEWDREYWKREGYASGVAPR